ncbi:MAG: capsular polysaccharide biosynthesis protein [Granulosicoccus sp.]|jgi:capsular polysaccharide biosynthesis protein
MGLLDRVKRLFWKIDDSSHEVHFERSEKPFADQQINFAEEKLNKVLLFHNNEWTHYESVVKVKNVTVEPQYAYAVSGLNTVVSASIRTRETLPSPLPMIKAKLFGRQKKMDQAILFDGSLGASFFHLFSDVLHKIYVLEDLNLMHGPLLVGESVFRNPVFQDLITQTRLRDYNWHLITEPIAVNTLIIARPMPYEANHWRRSRALFIKDEHQPKPEKRLFINRSGRRQIINMNEVRPILEKWNIEVIDPGEHSISEQAALFNSAAIIVGIHGAGLTNLLFCDHNTTKVLEICASDGIGCHYYWMCTALGMDWRMVLGNKGNADQSFSLSANKLDAALQELLVTT